MKRTNSLAGGFFIMAAIMIGFVWGMSRGEATAGVLIGTSVGAAIAVILWLWDRRRR